MTTYMVLRNTATSTENDRWEWVATKDASSASSAIRAALNGSEVDGEFVAVPARSWQPVKVQVETALKFS